MATATKTKETNLQEPKAKSLVENTGGTEIQPAGGIVEKAIQRRVRSVQENERREALDEQHAYLEYAAILIREAIGTTKPEDADHLFRLISALELPGDRVTADQSLIVEALKQRKLHEGFQAVVMEWRAKRDEHKELQAKLEKQLEASRREVVQADGRRSTAKRARINLSVLSSKRPELFKADSEGVPLLAATE